MTHQKHGKDANYDFKKQKEPSHRMGDGNFANMPDRPIMRPFPPCERFRGGMRDGTVCEVSDISGIEENER